MSDALIPQNSCVLVTGGAGFIGSHTVVELLNSGYEAVIVDDLSNASVKVIDRIKTIVGEENAKRLSFYEADVNDADALNHIFDEHAINFVIHFAGFKAVGESVTKPIEYYTNNLGTGTGSSVLDVIKAFSKACGKEIPYVIEPRRAGDVATNYADCQKAADMLGWKAQYDLADMCRDSWKWQSMNPDGYRG